MLPLSGWIAVAVLATSLPQAWSAAAAMHPSVLEHPSVSSAPMDQLKISAFKSSTKWLPVLGRGYTPKKRFLAVVTAGISVLAVLFLVFRCIRHMNSRSISFGTGGMRSLAVGGAAPCDTSDESDEDEDTGTPGKKEHHPTSLADKVQYQLSLLEVPEEELPFLTPDELVNVSKAKKALQNAALAAQRLRDAIAEAEAMLVTKSKELKKELKKLAFDQDSTPEVKSIQKALTEASEQRLKAIEEQELVERNLRLLAWDECQEYRASLILLGGHGEREMSKALAAALAAAERVLNPGKMFPQVPGGVQALKLLKIADQATADMNKFITLFDSLEVAVKNPKACARNVFEAKAARAKAKQIHQQLSVLSMPESAAAVESSIQKLTAALKTVKAAAATNPALAEAIKNFNPSDDVSPEPTGLSQELQEELCKEVQRQESEMLIISKKLTKALRKDLSTEADWKSLEESFVSGAAALVFAQQTELPGSLPPNKREAFYVAMDMCDVALRKVHKTIRSRLVERVTSAEGLLAEAIAALEKVRQETGKSTTLTPAGDRIMSAMTECRNAMTNARNARDQVLPLTAYHPTHVALHDPLAKLSTRLDTAQTIMVQSADEHVQTWIGRLEMKIDSFKRTGGEDGSSVSLQYLVDLAAGDLDGLMGLLETSPEFDGLLEAIQEARALIRTSQEPQAPATQRTGTLGRLAKVLGRGKKKSEKKKKE